MRILLENFHNIFWLQVLSASRFDHVLDSGYNPESVVRKSCRERLDDLLAVSLEEEFVIGASGVWAKRSIKGATDSC